MEDKKNGKIALGDELMDKIFGGTETKSGANIPRPYYCQNPACKNYNAPYYTMDGKCPYCWQ